MPLEGAFFYFLKNLISLIYRHSAVNGGVKKKMLKNGSILTGKKYVVQICKKK